MSTLKSTRLELRLIQPSDHQKIFEGLSHPDVIRYYGVSFDTFEATQEQMDWYKDLEENKKGLWWAVCLAGNQTFLGAGGLNDWNHDHRKAEIGFWLLPQHWGKGYMSEAMPLICNYAFKEMNIHRIEGFVDHGNRNCKKALAKLKFVFEGTMRECEWKNKEAQSIDVYSLLKTDV